MGFRPFFLLATLFAVVAMLAWTAAYSLDARLPFAGLAPTRWHAHELIFGYGSAVIAGFLLTAVRNWTGIDTVSGGRLAALASLWCGARIALLLPAWALTTAFALDVAFGALLFLAIARPIFARKQWKQAGVLAKVVLLTAGNAAFYLGALGLVEDGQRVALYAGFYVVLALILTMARRLIPFFVSRGVGYSVQLRNNAVVDVLALLLYVVFFVSEVFISKMGVAAVAAIALVGLHGWRAFGWHTPGIWRKPLLWSLYLSYIAVVAGFALYPLAAWGPLSSLLVLHAFAIGGFGLVTAAMMARVTIGHTGRNVHEAPPKLTWVFALLLGAVVARVGGPALLPDAYIVTVLLAQLLWIAAFAGLLVVCGPWLVAPRADGRPG